MDRSCVRTSKERPRAFTSRHFADNIGKHTGLTEQGMAREGRRQDGASCPCGEQGHFENVGSTVLGITELLSREKGSSFRTVVGPGAKPQEVKGPGSTPRPLQSKSWPLLPGPNLDSAAQ